MHASTQRYAYVSWQHDIKENVTGPGTRASRTALFHYNASLRRYLLDRHYLDSDVITACQELHLLIVSVIASVSPNPNDLIAFGTTEVFRSSIIVVSSP